MFQLINSDLARYIDGNENKSIAFLKTIYTNPSFLEIVWYRIGHSFWCRQKNPLMFILLFINRVLYPFIRMYSMLELSPKVQIGEGLYIAHIGPTIIHHDVVIGKNLTILPGVIIGAAKTGVPTIGDNVTIGAGAVIIGKINIGDNAIIGANAVVTRDIPEGCTVVGIPARLI